MQATHPLGSGPQHTVIDVCHCCFTNINFPSPLLAYTPTQNGLPGQRPDHHTRRLCVWRANKIVPNATLKWVKRRKRGLVFDCARLVKSNTANENNYPDNMHRVRDRDRHTYTNTRERFISIFNLTTKNQKGRGIKNILRGNSTHQRDMAILKSTTIY